MPAIEKDLQIGHDEAGSFFFLMSFGYCMMLLASGFVSSRLNHRRTIVLSSIGVGGALIVVSLNHDLWGIRLGLVLVGMAAGLYLPSGIATITELVRPEHWGKAIAIHELGPNLSFVAAPLLTEALLGVCSWRGVLAFIGIVSMIGGVVFVFWGKGGAFPGEAPDSRILRTVLTQRSFWIVTAMFTLGLAAQFGVYSMMPLYLVSERGMERPWANTLLGLSRTSTPAMVLLSGWATDRLGMMPTLRAIFITTGLMTMMLGLVPGSWIVPMVFLQPLFAACFFSAGFPALSRTVAPNIRNVAVSLSAPISFLLGGGAIPAGLGVIGEIGFFSAGFILLGGIILGEVILARYMKFPDDSI